MQHQDQYAPSATLETSAPVASPILNVASQTVRVSTQAEIDIMLDDTLNALSLTSPAEKQFSCFASIEYNYAIHASIYAS